MELRSVAPLGSPGSPLHDLSPERVNGMKTPQRTMAKLAQSPSGPEFGKPAFADAVQNGSPTRSSPFRSHRRNDSEASVQGMVARFNALEIRDHRDMHRRDELALKRAEMAREMAESEADKYRTECGELDDEVRRLREELRRMKKDVEEGKDRERRVMRRLDVVMEEAHRSKETQGRTTALYEKEIRKSRKEAFKSSSALVKLQEELKASRNSLRACQTNLETERGKAARREQEAFTAQYQLVGVQEELQKMRERIKVVEEERDALKTSLKSEEIARIAAEGRIALPSLPDDDDEFSSPIKSPRKTLPQLDDEDKENLMPPRKVEMKALAEQLDREKRLRSRAEEQVEFMKMECQFECCSCRIAERTGSRYVHDDSFATDMKRLREKAQASISPEIEDQEMEDTTLQAPPEPDMAVEPSHDVRTRSESPIKSEEQGPQPQECQPAQVEEQLSYSPSSGTFRRVSIMPEAADEAIEFELEEDRPTLPKPFLSAPRGGTVRPSEDTFFSFPDDSTFRAGTPLDIGKDIPTSDIYTDETDASTPKARSPLPPSTPADREIRTITTTTTIPIHFSPGDALRSDHLPPSASRPVTVAHTFARMMTPAKSHGIPKTPSAVTPGAIRPDGTIDREAALEMIRQRRGRARSLALGNPTPKKPVVGGGERRDISAPMKLHG